ncbi:MAG: hypothetical protein RL129_599 [Actinomycetota bacterium]
MRYKRILAWLIPTILISAATYLFGYSGIFKVNQVVITGAQEHADVNAFINGAQMNTAIGGELARVNVRGLENSLKNVGWIKSAKVSRDWFGGKVKVEIIARKALAKVVMAGSAGNTYIDQSGIIYEDAMGQSGLPEITISDSKLSGKAATFIGALPSELTANMRDLNLTSQGQFVMNLDNNHQGLLVLWGDGSNLATKVALYNRLIALPENKKISGIDLTNPKFPIVKK